MTKVNAVRLDALMRAVNKLEYKGDWTAYIREVSHFGESEIKEYAIGWASIGAVSADKTRQIIQEMEKLCWIVDTLNAMKIDVDWETKDTKITNPEAFHEAVEKIISWIEAGWCNSIQAFLEGGR